MTEPTKLSPEDLDDAGWRALLYRVAEGAAVAARAQHDRLVSLGIIDQAGNLKPSTSTPDADGQDGGGW